MAQKNSQKTIFTPSWALASESSRLFGKLSEQVIILALLPALLILLGSLLLGKDMGSHHTLSSRELVGLVTLLSGGIWSIINYPANFYLQLQGTKGKTPSVKECYRQGFPYFWRLIGLNILTGLFIFAGFLALVVPGFILWRRYFLSSYYLMDQNVGIREAMKRSSADSKKAAGYIWGVIGVQAVMSLAAAVVRIIPIFGIIAAPVISALPIFVPALRYYEVQKVK